MKHYHSSVALLNLHIDTRKTNILTCQNKCTFHCKGISASTEESGTKRNGRREWIWSTLKGNWTQVQLASDASHIGSGCSPPDCSSISSILWPATPSRVVHSFFVVRGFPTLQWNTQITQQGLNDVNRAECSVSTQNSGKHSVCRLCDAIQQLGMFHRYWCRLHYVATYQVTFVPDTVGIHGRAIVISDYVKVLLWGLNTATWKCRPLHCHQHESGRLSSMKVKTIKHHVGLRDVKLGQHPCRS